MTLLGGIFYFLAVLVLISAFLAVTARQLVHSVVFLAASFFATALIFYLLGAPLPAALEVIVYAGGIMILFLFIVMTMKRGEAGDLGSPWAQWTPAGVLVYVSLVAAAFLIIATPGAHAPLQPAMASPQALGRFLFEDYWFAVEAASYLLFVALVGALYLGRLKGRLSAAAPKEES